MDYGSVHYAQGTGQWVIRCEPHVRARLKRVFPRAPQQAADSIAISASPENTRDLEWFLQRYPMQISRADLMHQLAASHVETEQRLADLMAGCVPPAAVALAKPAREYQTFAATMLQTVRGYLLADDLGLGKTVSAICAMTLPGTLPAVVVCPAHLPRQWQRMVREFAPSLTTHIVKQSQPYDLVPRRRGKQQQLIEPRMPDVIIVSYHKLRGWAEHLRAICRYAIFDECQALRSPDTYIHAAATHLSAGATYRLGLSATPIHNFGNEFHHVVDVLAPGKLGEYPEFIREWCTPVPGGRARLSAPLEFGAYLRREGIMLRRTRAEVSRELPPLQKIAHDIDSDQRALEQLKGDAVALARIILRKNEEFRGQRMQASAEFDALMRQATGLAKAPYVVEFVKLLVGNGERVVLFGWHRAVYAIWMEGLAEYSPALYTGSESANQKAAAIDGFVAGRHQVLIMSLRSGAGVDGLQGCCNTVVIGEFDWSPAVHEQCIGRVYRDGQDAPCTAYFLISEAGADPLMAQVLGVKREQLEAVRTPGGALAERIDSGELSIRQLARDFLATRGEHVPAPDNVETIA